VEYRPALKFKTTTASSRRKAYAEVSDAIKKLRAEEKERAVVMVVQSQQVNMLCHDVPIMKEIPSSLSNTTKTTLAFRPLAGTQRQPGA